MKNADLQIHVNTAAQVLDQRWVGAARRVSAPMPPWVGIAASAGVAGGIALLAFLLPKPLRKIAMGSVAPVLISRVLK